MPIPHLSPREKELLRCEVRDWSITRTAREMGISPKTVAVHRSNIRYKLGRGYEGPHGLYIWATEHTEELKD